MNKSKAALDTPTKKPGDMGAKSVKGPVALPVFAPYDESRFGNENAAPEMQQALEGGAGTEDFQSKTQTEKTLREDELTNKDIRNARDLTLRQLLRIDNRGSVDQMNKYKTDGGDEGTVDAYNQTGKSGSTRR